MNFALGWFLARPFRWDLGFDLRAIMATPFLNDIRSLEQMQKSLLSCVCSSTKNLYPFR